MEEFIESNRQGVIIYFNNYSHIKQLNHFGHIKYISKKFKYILIYMDQSEVKKNIKLLRKMKFIKKVELSYRPFWRTDYSENDSSVRYQITEEDKDKFKTKGNIE